MGEHQYFLSICVSFSLSVSECSLCDLSVGVCVLLQHLYAGDWSNCLSSALYNCVCVTVNLLFVHCLCI